MGFPYSKSIGVYFIKLFKFPAFVDTWEKQEKENEQIETTYIGGGMRMHIVAIKITIRTYGYPSKILRANGRQ